MKKILALTVVLALIGSAVFAQTDASAKKWKFTFTADTVADVLYANVKTLGDDYLKEGQPFNPPSGEHPIYWSQFGMFANIAGANKWSTFDATELRLTYNYNGEFVTLYTRTNLDGIIDALLTNSNNGSWSGILSQTFDEVTLTAKLGDKFKAEISNTNKRGIFGDLRYSGNYDEFADPYFKGFGVVKVGLGSKTGTGIWSTTSGAYGANPGAAAEYIPLSLSKHEVNDFKPDASGATTIPGFLLTGTFGPVIASLYGGVVNTPDLTTSTRTPADVSTKAAANLGIRVEAKKLADLLDLAAVYKFTATDETRIGYNWIEDAQDIGKEGDPNGDGKSTHAFGILANIAPISTLGIAIGYSGQFTAKEEDKGKSTEMKYINPYWSGIDLKAHFTGIDKLPLDFTTNISFAGVKGNDDAKTTVSGLGITSLLSIPSTIIDPLSDNKYEESAVAWTAGLAANYSLTDKLIINGTFGNTLSVMTAKYDGSEAVATQNALRFYAGVIYKANPNVTFRGGLALRNTGNANEFKPKSGDSTKLSANFFEFGIPIGLKVTF